MKKILNITISVLLIIAMIVPVAIFASAEVNVSTTPSKQGGEPYEYYNLKDGLYTKKTVSGPLDNGNYQVELEAYTSDISLVSATESVDVDIMILVDTSLSMASNDKMDTFKEVSIGALKNLVEKHGVGTKHSVNVSVISFASAVHTQTDYTELNSQSISTKGKIYKALNGLVAAGGTLTGDAFQNVEKEINKRINNGRKQIVLFFSDGIPGFFTGMLDDKWTLFPQSGQANDAIKSANALKAKGVEIFSIGIGELFENTNDDYRSYDLAKIVTQGRAKAFSNWGKTYRYRQANIFMKILSSNWLSSSQNQTFDWINDDDASKIGDIYSQKDSYNYYYLWAGLNNRGESDKWQNIPYYYTINEKTQKQQINFYYGNAANKENMFNAISQALTYSLHITYKSQGSLLGDYTIKDTVSPYFEIINGSTQIYKVPYDYTKGAFKEGDDTDASSQYGARNRAWGVPTDITNKIKYTENENSVEVLASSENSSVIDTCVVDDIVDSSNEKHGGNKLRITFEIRPKDSFMGGSDVPTNIYKESGIFDKDGKAVQNFANLSTTGVLDTSSVPKLQVELVDANVRIDDDNVKIGYLYNLDDLGQKNLTLTYKGRYSNNEYTVKLKDSEYVVYDATGTEVKYSESKASDENSKSVDTKPNDYAEIIIGENHIDETLNNKGIVANSKLIQFNSTGITQTDGKYSMQTPKVNKYVYLLWKGMKTSSTYLNERFPEYNKTGKDSKATTLDGIVNGIRYFSGREAIRQLDTQFNVNVFVPTIKVSDAISGGNSEYPYDSAAVSDAFDKYSSQNKDAVNVYKNNEILTSLVFAQIDTSAGEFVHLIPNGSTVTVDSTQHSGFLSDTFSTSSASSISAYVKAFADKDGNIKTANSVISDKDQIKLTLSYNELADKTASFPTDAPFKFTVDEFWAANECSVCKDNERYIPQFLGYQEQVHVLDRTSSITVNKTGCDANHTNESFVFSVLAFKSKSDNSGADLSTMKVLNNFTIQGNGQRTITVDNQYDYYCVVEDLNSLNNVTSGWTWDYSGVSVNGTDWDTIENNLFKLESKQIKVLTFNNQYDNNNNNLHYASAYASNIMSHDKIEVITSPAQQSTN